jgi:hypothetical protein
MFPSAVSMGTVLMSSSFHHVHNGHHFARSHDAVVAPVDVTGHDVRIAFRFRDVGRTVLQGPSVGSALNSFAKLLDGRYQLTSQNVARCERQ